MKNFHQWLKSENSNNPQQKVITPELAWRLRQRGLLLPVNGSYTTERLHEIAISQHNLIKEMQTLENEIKTLNDKLKVLDDELKTSANDFNY